MKKQILIPIIWLLTLASAYATNTTNVNVSVNVTPYVAPPSAGIILLRGAGGLIMGVGGLMMLMQTFVWGTPPEDKIKAIIYGVFYIVFLVAAIGIFMLVI
jgi:hypothetical protein